VDNKTKEENKKYLLIAIGIILICFIYHLFFRYEYKIYEDKYDNGYTVKLDKLTGKSEQKYATKSKCTELRRDLEEAKARNSIFVDIIQEVYNENCKS